MATVAFMPAIATGLTDAVVGYAKGRTAWEVEFYLLERFPLTGHETAVVLEDIRRCVQAKKAGGYVLLSCEAYYTLVHSLWRLN